MALDSRPIKMQYISMTVTAEIGAGQLADLVKQVQAGDEVLLTQGHKLVAKLVAAVENGAAPRLALPIRSVKAVSYTHLL